MNVLRTATFAEYTIVDQSQVVKVPADMPLDRASMLACGVITGFGAVVNRMQVKPMSSVVVIGTGGVGLNAIQGAAYSGAYPVIAVDIADKKLEDARFFGATHGVNSKKEDAVAKVRELTDGGADYIFVTVGNIDVYSQALMMSGKRGVTVAVGLTPPKSTMPVAPIGFIDTEKMFTGCYMGSTNLSIDIPRLVNLYKMGKLKLDELITGRYPLEKINEAIASVEKGEARRNIIMF